MSGDRAAAGPDWSHQESTISLARLAAGAIAQMQGSIGWSSEHAVGEWTFTVRSNDERAGAFLTRCLVPAEPGRPASARLQIHVLVGSSQPFVQPPPWNLPHTDPRHLERLHLSGDGMVSAFYDHERRFWVILDRAAGRALLWIARAQDLPFWEQAAPFRQILQWSFVGTGMSMLHGGVVTLPDHGVLLAGRGGSGKSTTVAACFQAGLGVCGDDLVVAERTGSGWSAHAVYDAIKLLPNDALPAPAVLQQAPWRPCGDKRLVRYSDARPEGFVRTTRLHALVHCVLAGGARSRLVPATPSQLLMAIGPSTVFLLRGRESHLLAEIGSLVRTLPCLRLELGDDPAAGADLLRAWLGGTGRG